MLRHWLMMSTSIRFAADGGTAAGEAGGGTASAGGAAAGGAAGAAGAAADAGVAAGGGDAGSTPAGGGAAPAGGGIDWIGALPEDERSFVKLKGYQSPSDLIKAYHNAERAIGLDKVALPKDDSPKEVWDEYYRKIGRPEKADGYQFKAPESLPDYDPKMAGWFGEVAYELGLTAKQAAGMHDRFMEMVIKTQGASGQQLEQLHAANYAKLQQEWGVAAPAKIEAANRAIRHFGGDELVKVFKERGLNSDPALNRAFAKIGEAMADDGLHGTGAGGGLSLTPEEAKKEIARMNADTKGPLYDKFHPEHQIAIDKRNSLYQMAYPEDRQRA